MFLLYLIASDQPLRTQANMAAGAHHDMVVDGDAEPLARLRDRSGDVDVGAAGGGVAARVIVDEDDRRGSEVDRAADDLRTYTAAWSIDPLLITSSRISMFLVLRWSTRKRSIAWCAMSARR